MKILNIVGARPNFIKIASLYRAYRKYNEIRPILIHTRQHYDYQMSDVFFENLQIPTPDYILNWNNIEEDLKKVFLKEKPDVVLVVGDVDSSLKAAKIAKQMKIKVAHVEAGLRSFDNAMPEERNRIEIDHLSDWLFVNEQSGVDNLKKEGIDDKKVFFVGNVMIDSLIHFLPEINSSKILEELNLKSENFIIQTIHRQSNVDNKENLEKLLEINKIIAENLMIVFCVHPRTRKSLEKFNLWNDFENLANVKIIDPLNYFDMLFLIKNSFCVMTDSGGLQEEAAFLKIPTLTLRENTERPSTIEVGANKLVGLNREEIINQLVRLKDFNKQSINNLDLVDGKASVRIIEELIT